ncbi:SGNH/GDSL hydrolase family protein [bacterium]|nr:SGNH/GDSL hydrolase family protein [bacterium]
MMGRSPRAKRIFVARLPRRALAFAFGCVAALLVAEIGVRALAIDIGMAELLMFYQDVDSKAHVPDPDPRLFFRLKPGAVIERGNPRRRVTINRHGARGTEYTDIKPPGVFRIVAVGGSNVYGVRLDDTQTWPARLEERLNAGEPGRYEVWNFGTAAYGSESMAVVAHEALGKYSPDLIIFAMSNVTGPTMLPGTRLAPYVERDPTIMTRLLNVLGEIPGERKPTPATLRAAGAVRIYRLALLTRLLVAGKGWGVDPTHEANGVREYKRLLEAARDRARVVLFFCPGADPLQFRRYRSAADIPEFVLTAGGKPAEYLDLHPPAYVMTWYAEHLAAWLRDNGHLEPLP